jgi:hypothetical protein
MKVGLDDFFATGGTVEELLTFVVNELPAPDQPAYPIAAFPPAAQRYITETSAALNNSPPEMIGLPLLGFAAGAIGNTRVLHVKGDWWERSILWVAVVAPTGSAKTPAQEAARRPLQHVQDAAVASWGEDMERFQRDLAEWESLPKPQQGKIAKSKEPPFPHFITTDATKEGMAPMAADSPGFTVYRDELVAWVESFDAYRGGRGGDRQDMLSLWSGGGLKIDRKGAPPIIARRPTISVVGGVQPALLPRLSQDAGSDGFLARFLWAWPEVGVLRWTPAQVSAEAAEGITNLFAGLRVPLDTHPDGYRVRLSARALARFAPWHDENADEQEAVGPLLAGVYAKFPSQVLRIALVLHCLWHPSSRDDAVSLATMNGAIDLVEFHRVAAVKMAQLFHETRDLLLPKLGPDERVIRKIGKSEGVFPERWVPLSHISDGIRPRVAPKDLAATLAELVDGDRLEHRRRSTTSKPVDEYRLRKSDFPNFSRGDSDEVGEGEEGEL